MESVGLGACSASCDNFQYLYTNGLKAFLFVCRIF